MKYKLVNNSDKGILIDRTPLLRDIRDTFEVSFIIPESGAYAVLFKDAEGFEYRKIITDGKCRIPKELLKREQYAELSVCKFDSERVLHTWHCEPLKIAAFSDVRQSQWQISGGMTDRDCYARLCELEELCAEIKSNDEVCASRLAEQAEVIDRQVALVGAQEERIGTLAGAVQELVKQVGLIESSYNIIDTINEREE